MGAPTEYNVQIEERSSQLLRNWSSCEKKAWKVVQCGVKCASLDQPEISNLVSVL